MQLLKNKNQNKSNKVRFQHGQFAKKLDRQRNFKRKVRFVPTNIVDRILASLGLNSRLKQLLALVILAGAVYVVYAPNIMTVGTVKVTGASDKLNSEIEQVVESWLQSTPFYIPRKNILFLGTSKLQRHLLDDSRVYQVSQVRKKIKGRTLDIVIVPRKERFLVYTPERIYDVYNDGFMKSEAGLSLEQWRGEIAPHLIKLKLPGNIDNTKQFLLSAEWVSKLESLQQKLAQFGLPNLEYVAFGKDKLEDDGIGNVRVAKLSPLPFQPDELILELTRLAGGAFQVTLDPRSNLEEALMRLGLLYNQTQPERLSKLKYIDMRLEERGFICLEDAVCAQGSEAVN